MEEEKRLKPKFLTNEIAAIAVDRVLDAVFNEPVGSLVSRRMCHLVILAPSMKDDSDSDYLGWPNYPLEPAMLYERSFGDVKKWPYPFDNIARCKALQLWHGRQDGGTDIQPHLLFPGDAPFWGGVKRHGLVSACSGVQPHFDRMIAGMVLEMVVGLSYNLWLNSSDKADDERCFLR